MKHITKHNLASLVILTASMFSASAIAGQADIDKIEAATSTLNTTELTNLTQSLSGYDKALAYYRLSMSANLKQESDLAEQSLDQAMAILELLDQEQTQNAEVKALLAQVYGYKIALSPIKGVVYGGKSQKTLQLAESLAPTNPRVLLVKGIGAANTPPMFGGSKEEALQAFDKSIQAYDNDMYSNYYWGHSEAYTWRGLLHAQLGDSEQAMADWQKALEIDPGYGWAKVLIAQANR